MAADDESASGRRDEDAAGRERLRARLREWFPALAGPTIFLENAGGSQVPDTVAAGVGSYMLSSYVQLGAGYPLSRLATDLVERAHRLTATLMGARRGRVALGPSTSVLLRLLADSYGDWLPAGREVVVAESGHEANVGPWKRLAHRGVPLRWWRFDPERMRCPLEELRRVLSSRTALVALPHVSNLLGGVEDLRRVVEMAHDAGARVVADGVAYAPHRAMDVDAWDVDWYAFSCYKVYGPHMAALYGKDEAFAELVGPNHFFVPAADIPYKFELGGADHEACAGWLGVAPYLAAVAGDGRRHARTAAGPAASVTSGRAAAVTPPAGAPAGVPEEGLAAAIGSPLDRATVLAAGSRLESLEAPLVERLLAWVRGRDDLRLIGPAAAGPDRVGTVSFVHRGRPSREIAAAVDASGIGIRHGHMYAWHLCDALGLEPEDGVVRISLLHYNTPAEIERLIEVLEAAL